MHAPEHDWKLVAPWWRWPGLPARIDTVQGRLTRPAIQKYETSNLVNEFLRDPQRCLKFVLDDVVPSYGKRYVPFRTIGSARKAREVIAGGGPVEVDPADGREKFVVPTRVRTADGLRKLYLDTHKRFYLVVCQFHCDAPGFPKVSREKICEAGLVVRRRTTDVPAPAAKEAKALLAGIARRRVQVERLAAAIPGLRADGLPGQVGDMVRNARLDAAVQQRAFTLALLEQERRRLADWAMRFEVAPTLQGWFRTPGLDGVGQWELVQETPDALGCESTFPLYPLVPDRNELRHAGQFGTIFFGLLPTGLADHDANGRARFREQEYYEVRCWARRHLEPHDRGTKCRCPDHLFWSAPTEPYWLAGHYDHIGTSQRPVTVQLPDLKDLAADPRPRPGATFSKPPGSLSFSVGPDQKPTKRGFTGPGFQICTLPIPLITIVAMFVLELFLPIIVFLFGLFWMLLLKFCIPPEVDVGGGLTLELQGQAGVVLDASGKIDVNLTTDAAEDALHLTEAWGGAPQPGVSVNAGATWVPDVLAAEFPPPSKIPDDLRSRTTTAGIVNWQIDAQASGTTRIPSVTEGIVFETEYEHP